MAPGRRVYKIRRDDGSSTVEVIDCALDEAGRHVFTGQGGKLVALAGLHAWNVMDCEAGKSLTLCLMGLGLARAPYANAPNMWWQDQVDWAGPGDSLRARIERTVGGMIGPFTRWRGQHLVSRYLASGRQDRVQIQTMFETPAGAAGARAVDIKITLEAVKGVTEIDGRWGDESFHIQLTSFEVATYS
jgi:hypothetical protein